MSVYEFLSIPLPTVAYVVVHQPRPGTNEDDYVATMREMHRIIAEESVVLQANYAKFLKEAALRESQMLRGSISQFLETPIRSDKAEVQNIFGESFERFRDLITHRAELGVKESTEGRFLRISPRSAGARKHAAAARRHFDATGFHTGSKNPGSVFESIFLVDGGLNLDVIEYLVRDKMGIYAAPHGSHLGTSSAFTFSVYNLVVRHGSGWRDGAVECVVTFPKTPLPYDRFRGDLLEELEVLRTDLGVTASSIWQRKLGLGRGNEFIFRYLADTSAHGAEIFESLCKRKDASPIATALKIHGTFAVKEYISHD